MAISATVKSQVFIGTTSYPAGQTIAPVQADYTGDTWIEIGAINSIGDVGDTAEEIKTNLISEARTIKLKGQRDAGDFTLECAFDDADTGQQALIAANTADGAYNFKIVQANKLTPTGNGSTVYFRGSVMSAQTKMGAANSIVMLSTKVSINSAPTRVLAS